MSSHTRTRKSTKGLKLTLGSRRLKCGRAASTGNWAISLYSNCTGHTHTATCCLHNGVIVIFRHTWQSMSAMWAAAAAGNSDPQPLTSLQSSCAPSSGSAGQERYYKGREWAQRSKWKDGTSKWRSGEKADAFLSYGSLASRYLELKLGVVCSVDRQTLCVCLPSLFCSITIG